VAETLMKKLYNRNKELENYHKLKSEGGMGQPMTPSKPHFEVSTHQNETLKHELEQELEEKQKTIDRLQTEVQELAKRADKASNEKQSTYVEFLEDRLHET
jgi:uncharacterized coiled-coil protein SlyX